MYGKGQSRMTGFPLAPIAFSLKSLNPADFATKLADLLQTAKSKDAVLVVFPEFSIAPIITAMREDFFKATDFVENEIKQLAQQHALYVCSGSGLYEIESKVYNQFFLTRH